MARNSSLNGSLRRGALFPHRPGFFLRGGHSLILRAHDEICGNNRDGRASYLGSDRPWGPGRRVMRLHTCYGKDGSPVKKLLALLVVGGVLGLITGCPPATTG